MTTESGLSVENLTIRYGGHVAVSKFSLAAPGGRLTGLIGPNGAGKTTTFNACSGLLAPSEGTIHLDGRNVTGMGASARARYGLGRTFQKMELFKGLTVAENVALGRDAGLGGANPLRHVFRTGKERRQVAEQRDAAIELCGIAHLATSTVGRLSTGQQRLVELARVVAGGFAMLLLDEPSSGLDGAESERFGEILGALVRERGVGILLVEHDMALVMRVCDYLFVLDFGQGIFAGTPEQTRASQIVRAAYLGSDTVQEAVNADA